MLARSHLKKTLAALDMQLAQLRSEAAEDDALWRAIQSVACISSGRGITHLDLSWWWSELRTLADDYGLMRGQGSGR